MKDDKVYIEQVLDAVRKIEEFTTGFDFVNFSADEKTQSAVILQLAIIGEVAKKISEQEKSQIDLPWKEIIGFRDRAIHDYFGIDIEIVWQTIQVDIPELKMKLMKSAN
ncbi:MAG: hypothetical protein G01um101417_175 [Parcubacteria group bacterium Gr01-1014_17]|nr:MAG: hypothetical protein G01um101417_175 [Parcubacteria group bacterium Gr01-1014_17]